MPPEPAPDARPAAGSSPPQIAVVGGGVTGLAAAHRLRELRPDAGLALFESASRFGGVLQTVRRDGFLVERSADNFLTKTPFATALCERLGLADKLLPTNADRRRALLVNRGRVRPTPAGFVIAAPKRLWPLLSSDLLSPAGRLRLACEPLVPARRDHKDESVADFARRRLGAEALLRLVQPLVGGIYTADLERLSVNATLPQLREQERRHGSLWRAALAERAASNSPGEQADSGARYGAFLAPIEGMGQIVEALVDRLGADVLHRHASVLAARRRPEGWDLVGDRGEPLGLFDGVILATPAPAAARIVAELDGRLTAELDSIEHASSVVVCLAYRFDQFPRLPTGFGIVVPACEGRRILAASFSSLKFPGRSPDGELLVRVFVGGALQPGLTTLEDDELVRLAAEELADLLKLTGRPRPLEVVRWPAAMPQYHVGHLERVERIEALVAAHPGLELAGAAYRGVGVPQCIESGERAAERLFAHIA